jgi:succinyl-CoA synthetase alpha subunit
MATHPDQRPMRGARFSAPSVPMRSPEARSPTLVIGVPADDREVAVSILVNKDTRLLVQGITGREGEFHTRQMIDYGTNVVGGVTPSKGGSWVAGVPVFDTVREAVNATGANASIVYVPARFAPDAILEAADAGLSLVVCIAEGIPTLDMIRVRARLECTGTRLIGPNCPGLITPGEAKLGIMPGHIHTPGPVGVVSRSGTLTYEVVHALTLQGLGQSTAIGIGGDPIIGTDFIDILRLFEQDAQTDRIVLIGEIGGTDEERAAAFIARQVTKPVVAFVAGQTAPPGKRMGHAGAIIQGGEGTAAEKIKAFKAVGVRVASHPGEIADLVADLD